jgi:hypothetical protein
MHLHQYDRFELVCETSSRCEVKRGVKCHASFPPLPARRRGSGDALISDRWASSSDPELNFNPTEDLLENEVTIRPPSLMCNAQQPVRQVSEHLERFFLPE